MSKTVRIIGLFILIVMGLLLAKGSLASGMGSSKSQSRPTAASTILAAQSSNSSVQISANQPGEAYSLTSLAGSSSKNTLTLYSTATKIYLNSQQIDTSTYFKNWQANNFAETKTGALLQANNSITGLSLSAPSYDNNTKSITFHITIASSIPQVLQKAAYASGMYNPNLSPLITKGTIDNTFQKTILLIDMPLAKSIGGCSITRNTTCVGANLFQASLGGIDLNNSNLENTNLVAAILAKAQLVNTNLTGASLFRADLSGVNATSLLAMKANFTQISGQKADFSQALLTAAVLRRADLKAATFDNAHLENAKASDIAGENTSFKNAQMHNIDLSHADLKNADLSGADLSGANLSYADLSGANLSRANLSGADLYKATTTGVFLNNTRFANTKCQNGLISNKSCI